MRRLPQVTALLIALASAGGAAYWYWSPGPVQADPAEPPRNQGVSPDAKLAAAEAAWVRGNIAMQREAFGEARAAYDEAIAKNPNYALAFVGRGNAQLAFQNYNAAISDFNAALKRDPELAEAYLSRAATNWLLGALSEAEEDHRRLTRLRPDNAYYGFLYAGVLREQGKQRQEEEFYRTAYARNPENEWALQGWLEMIYERENAAGLLSQAMDLRQSGVNTAIVYAAIGKAQYELQHYKDATISLAPIAEEDPTGVPPEALYYLGQSYLMLGQIADCRRALENYAMRLGRHHQYNPAACGVETAS